MVCSCGLPFSCAFAEVVSPFFFFFGNTRDAFLNKTVGFILEALGFRRHYRRWSQAKDPARNVGMNEIWYYSSLKTIYSHDLQFSVEMNKHKPLSCFE